MGRYLIEKNEYYKKLSKRLEKALNVGDIELSKKILTELGDIDNATVCTQKAIYEYLIGNVLEAKDILEKSLVKHPFNYEIQYNLCFILNELESFKSSIQHAVLAVKYAVDDKQRKNSIQLIEEILKNAKKKGEQTFKSVLGEYENKKRLLEETDYRVYPLNADREDCMRTVYKEDGENQYLINMYKSMNISSVDSNSRFFFKSELIKGKENRCEINLQLRYPAVIPFSLMEPQTNVTFFINDKEYKFKETFLSYNKIHYIKINEPGNLVIKSNKNVFVGTPIQNVSEKVAKKLVLQIFIDGISMKYLEEKGLAELMPNTSSFFKEGFISTNCFGTSEWTMPCKASVNTGKYPTNHKLLHPALNFQNFEKNHKLMSEYFSEAGYLTTKISSNWRTNPAFGYYKGFDRILYQNFMGGMDVRDTIMEVIEHLESFKDKNNFLSMSIMDVHNVPDEIENHILTETQTDLAYRVRTKTKGITSVQTRYDESKVYKYGLEIKRVDFFLGILFDYINKNYDMKDIVVLLHSDHGQTFLENTDEILHGSRTKIPLMLKGEGIPHGKSNEIIELVDLLPIILKATGLQVSEEIDGILPKTLGGTKERRYAITQLIHPNQTYQARIEDEKYIFRFTSKENVQFDLTFNIDNYKSSLLDKETGEEVSAIHSEIIDFYERVVYQHIKNFITW
ncbi:sulfatase-like hydrolase/transferase [Aciduricibacillus chroicocephali]|uniref:Sulfatase-like hydrolase/transferase n=1 Tax=Aciduricibacillus chroicocephali TaxID=3054939 RepID=A0ABY9KWV7_9BACI|nr:sulfatase-like hydrolase/transferase [Bacillaceae bacterium 44XB]